MMIYKLLMKSYKILKVRGSNQEEEQQSLKDFNILGKYFLIKLKKLETDLVALKVKE